MTSEYTGRVIEDARFTSSQADAPSKVNPPPEPVEDSEVHYSVSTGLAKRLADMGASLAFSSYQSGMLYFVGLKPDGGVNIHQAAMPKPMGLSRDARGGLILSNDYQIMRFVNVLDAGEVVNQTFDACYVPRVVHVTGRLDAHDVGVNADDEVVFINTRFNCLARLSLRDSFDEVWRPPFISTLIDEDRCHLNGLAMLDGKPRYVTAISRSDTIDGWRDRRSDGGVVIDVETGDIVCEGLSMPHSPRMHNGELWVLNSGTGQLGVVKLPKSGSKSKKGTFEPRVFCPGFLRGLRLVGNLAIVGLSKPRYKRFEELALDQKLREVDSEPWCGLQIIDLDKNACVDWFRIDGSVSKLYDLEILPGVACAMAVPPVSHEVANLITHKKTTIQDQP